MLFKRFKDWATTITAFRTGDVIPVDGPSGTAKMPKVDLLKETAQNALAGNAAPAFDPTRTSENPYLPNQSVVKDGVVYLVNTLHYGTWNGNHFTAIADFVDYSVSIKVKITDCDDVRSPGIYGVDSNAANVPQMSSNGILVCFQAQTMSRVVQFIFTAGSQKIWTRTAVDSSTWTDWSYLSNSVDIKNSVMLKTTDNTDFNDIKKTGFYKISSGSKQNSPIDFGILVCYWISLQSGGRGTQVAFDHENNVSYRRTFVNGSWTSWVSDAVDLFVTTPLQKISVDDLSSIVALPKMNGLVSGSGDSSYVRLQPQSSYKTYLYYVGEKDAEFYFDDTEIAGLSYLSIAYGKNPSHEWSFVTGSDERRMLCTDATRLRNTDNNLPKVNSKLVVPAGSVVMFTCELQDTIPVHTNSQGYLSKIVESCKEKPVSILYNNDNEYLIHFGKKTIYLRHIVSVDNDQDNWNLLEIRKNGRVVVPSGTDIIGPVKLVGDDDFIGGVHGSETTISLDVYSENKKLTLDSSLNESCEKLVIVAKSVCRKESDGTNAFNRLWKAEISADKISVSSSFESMIDSTIEKLTIGGLFAVQKSDLIAVGINSNFVDGVPESSSAALKDNVNAVFVTTNGFIEINNVQGKEKDGYRGYYTPLDSRVKIYFDVIDSNTSINVGDKFFGACEYKFV